MHKLTAMQDIMEVHMNWRKWKKNLLKKKIWRNSLRISSILLCLIALTIVFPQFNSYAANDGQSLSDIYKDRDAIKVIHHKIYVCGEEVEEIGRLTFEQTLEIMMQHPKWEITTDESRAVIRLKESISDLSSYCKEHAYFGISTINDLSLFDGVPDENKVIKTFFQLNIPYMESHLHEQEWNKLKSGIRVRNIAEYESVIATFSEYSADKTDQVCRPYY